MKRSDFPSPGVLRSLRRGRQLLSSLANLAATTVAARLPLDALQWASVGNEQPASSNDGKAWWAEGSTGWDGLPGRELWTEPGRQITYRLNLCMPSPVFQTRCRLENASAPRTFSLNVRVLDTSQTQQWRQRVSPGATASWRVDLSAFRGQRIEVMLGTESAAKNLGTSSGHCVWSNALVTWPMPREPLRARLRQRLSASARHAKNFLSRRPARRCAPGCRSGSRRRPAP